MSHSPKDVDEITARFRHEDARLRRTTMVLTLGAVLVGLVVVSGAWFMVDRAKQSVADANREIANLEKRRDVLDKQIADRSKLIEAHADELPTAFKNQLRSQEQAQTVELTQLDREQEQNWKDIGIAAARKGKYEEAVAAYDKALEINPRNKQIYNWRGYSCYRDGRYAEAANSLTRAAALDPEFAEAHYNLALAFWKLEKREEAAQEFKLAIKLDPDYEIRAKTDPQSAGLRRQLNQGPQ